MEQNDQERDHINRVPKFMNNCNPPKITNTQSLLKLPLAPILPITPDKKPTMVSTRRGIYIFSPTHHEKEQHPAQTPSPKTPAPSISKPPPSSSQVKMKYKECRKNHAAKIGGHIVDGCGEFMPHGDEPLKCVCCGCHRNFHREEVDTGGERISIDRPASGVASESSSEDRKVAKSGDKRFRTKFSQEQKERMEEFAVKLGWGMRKEDEEEVKRFCGEVGLEREVFRVWMNNSKQSRKRKQHLLCYDSYSTHV